MATFLNNDNAIWLKHVNAEPDTLALLKQFPSGAKLELEIEGMRGNWVKMKTGQDGRPTLGFRPERGKTLEFWNSMSTRRGEQLSLRVVDPSDSYLSDIIPTLSEWSSPEDDVAFRDL